MDAAPARPFLTARWIHLALANYAVDPACVAALVPRGTELDTWNGTCFVSVVGFQFLETRVLGLPIPFHTDFDEVNLRFYVRRVVDGEVRRGVVFVKEIVPRSAIAWAANTFYGEKYVALPMAHDDALATAARTLEYRWRFRGEWQHLRVALAGDAYLPDEVSEEAFITEHYWGYTAQRDGSTLEYRVEHPRWNVWRAAQTELVCDVAAFYGAAFAPFLARPPSSCFVADGSAVTVRRGRKL